MFVSIIIPTYNEASDIRETLDSLVALDYDNKEIIVIDASKDETPQIVRGYAAQQVRLIIQTRGRGRAAARNEGILAARGEIIVILNADVRLPRDFIQRILKHYDAGADYVLVDSRVTNTEYTTARYVQALHEFHYPPVPAVEAKMNWTEGFSCRRDIALAVGGIPEGDALPLVAGEDGWFGEKLEEAKYRKVFDRSIIVTHVMPADLIGFWHQRVGRGQGVVQIWRLRDHWSNYKIICAVMQLIGLGGLALIFPIAHLIRSWHLAHFSKNRAKDWGAFTALACLESAANILGLIVGIQEILNPSHSSHAYPPH